MGPRLPRARKLRGSALRRLESVVTATAKALLVPYLDLSDEVGDWSCGDCRGPGSRDPAHTAGKTADAAARRST